MWIQFSENLPRFRVDLEKLSYHFDTSGDPETDVELFYSKYLEVIEGGRADDFFVGPEYGNGIHVLLERLASSGQKKKFIKVQVTGPLSFALTVTDENRKPIFYHPLFKDVAIKAMGLKAIWLVEKFSPYAEKVIVFLDEPSLSAYGSSAFLGVSAADVTEALDDVISMVAQRGALTAIHCCGNTDWGLLMDSSIRAINFDAVDYMDSMAIYPQKLNDFMARGGVLAWGAVPNTSKVMEEDAHTVIQRIRNGAELLISKGVSREALTNKLIVTPACGCAGLKVSETQKVYKIMNDLDSRSISDIF
jgi:methionine synthase II (cobalamin-independent)